jgi:hypothetical protein
VCCPPWRISAATGRAALCPVSGSVASTSSPTSTSEIGLEVPSLAARLGRSRTLEASSTSALVALQSLPRRLQQSAIVVVKGLDELLL